MKKQKGSPDAGKAIMRVVKRFFPNANRVIVFNEGTNIYIDVDANGDGCIGAYSYI